MTEFAQLPDRSYAAFLFDMDGTILSSIAAAERVWATWFRLHGLDAEALMASIHGVRAVETLRRLAVPGMDIEFETAWLTQAELDDVEGIVPIAGAAAFLAALPSDRWAVVTSAPRILALRRLAAAGLPAPPMMVAGDDVEHGKPAPDCFLLAAKRLGFPVSECLVFEDAPAGIAAGMAAGADVLVITATHTHVIETPYPTVVTYEGLSINADTSGGLRLVRAVAATAGT